MRAWRHLAGVEAESLAPCGGYIEQTGVGQEQRTSGLGGLAEEQGKARMGGRRGEELG